MKTHQPSGVETWESRRSGSVPKVLSVFSLLIYVFSFSLVTGNEIIFKISSPKLYLMPGIVDMMLKVVADGDEANLEQKSMSCEKHTYEGDLCPKNDYYTFCIGLVELGQL